MTDIERQGVDKIRETLKRKTAQVLIHFKMKYTHLYKISDL